MIFIAVFSFAKVLASEQYKLEVLFSIVLEHNYDAINY